MAKTIFERILSNALTRVGTNVLTRSISNRWPPMAPSRPAAVQAMPRIAKFVPENPQRSFYVNTNKGFLRKHYNGSETVIDHVVDMREATPFRSFAHADGTAKRVVKKYPANKRWFCVVQPTIGK